MSKKSNATIRWMSVRLRQELSHPSCRRDSFRWESGWGTTERPWDRIRVRSTFPLKSIFSDIRKHTVEGHQGQWQQRHLLHLVQGQEDDLCHILGLAREWINRSVMKTSWVNGVYFERETTFQCWATRSFGQGPLASASSGATWATSSLTPTARLRGRRSPCLRWSACRSSSTRGCSRSKARNDRLHKSYIDDTKYNFYFYSHWLICITIKHFEAFLT